MPQPLPPKENALFKSIVVRARARALRREDGAAARPRARRRAATVARRALALTATSLRAARAPRRRAPLRARA